MLQPGSNEDENREGGAGGESDHFPNDLDGGAHVAPAADQPAHDTVHKNEDQRQHCHRQHHHCQNFQ